MGDFSKTINKNIKIKIKKNKNKSYFAPLCVSLSWFKETGGLHSVRRSRVPTGTTVLWLPARAKRGLEEECCATASERRGGGG